MCAANILSPADPEWLEGTKDQYMASAEDKVISLIPFDLGSVLDVGAGSGKHSKIMFPKATRCDLHVNESEGIEYGDILDLKYGDSSFDTVHVRRVLSNVETIRRKDALSELLRVAKEHVIIVDVYKTSHDNIRRLRLDLGMPPLPPPSFGLGSLEHELFSGQKVIWHAIIGPDYYIWNRVFAPKMLGREIGFDEKYIRMSYPTYSENARQNYGVHRIWALKK